LRAYVSVKGSLAFVGRFEEKGWKLARSTSTAHEFDHARGLDDVRDSIDAAFGAKRI